MNVFLILIWIFIIILTVLVFQTNVSNITAYRTNKEIQYSQPQSVDCNYSLADYEDISKFSFSNCNDARGIPTGEMSINIGGDEYIVSDQSVYFRTACSNCCINGVGTNGTCICEIFGTNGSCRENTGQELYNRCIALTTPKCKGSSNPVLKSNDRLLYIKRYGKCEN